MHSPLFLQGLELQGTEMTNFMCDGNEQSTKDISRNLEPVSRRNIGVLLQFSSRSREVIIVCHMTSHDVAELSGMSNDVREECMESHMTS